MILLDTNVVSEAQRPQGSARVKKRVEDHAGDLCLSAIVMGELRFGIGLLRIRIANPRSPTGAPGSRRASGR
ncbi:MAG TPA: PIN domain-containing protein [Amaricoccus sp.]|nr:PIN domain-containing protein [Amaricoccus sp.]